MPNAPKPVWAFEDFLRLVPPYGWIRDYLAYATQCTDAPPGFHVIAAIAAMALAISRNKVCMVNQYNSMPIPLHMFLLITGDSGSRKSASIKRMINVISPVLNKVNFGSKVWWPESCSVEGIIEGFAEDPNRLLVVGEWTELNANMQSSYAKSSPEFWNLVHDGMPIQRRKVGGRVILVSDPRVSIVGGSIPELIKLSVGSRDWFSGKFARYLILHMSKPLKAEMAYALDRSDLVASLQKRFEDFLVDAPPSKMNRFSFSKEACEYKLDWEHSQDWLNFRRSLPAHLEPFGLRASDHTWRLATLYQASMDYPWENVVGVDATHAAVEMVWTCALSMLGAFATLPLHDQTPPQRVLATLKAAGAKGIERRELMRKLHIPARKLDELIKMFQETGELLVQRRPGDLNPLYNYVCHKDLEDS